MKLPEMEKTWTYKWEVIKIHITEFFWRFHPHRNRWCKYCGEFMGNSDVEASFHECDEK